MARYFDVHPRDPQPRAIAQVVAMLRDDALVAYPTDSGYALGCTVGARTGLDRIRRLRHLDDRHHFTLMCSDFGQLAEYVRMDNPEFRAVKAATPGPYTFILRATREVPRRLANPRKHTVGVRITPFPVAQALLHELGEPLVTSTFIPPGSDEPLTDGWSVQEEYGHDLDAVLDCGECGREPTTVVDFTDGEPEVVRVGAGDPERFA